MYSQQTNREDPRIKRRRSSVSSDSAPSSEAGPSRSTSPAPKYHRATSHDLSERYVCILSPICDRPNSSSTFPSQEELERHKERFHRWICRAPIRDRGAEAQAARGKPVDEKMYVDCGKAFPDEKLLQLHHTETHDPIARERQARGEKIFECFLPVIQCSKSFLTPAKRRRHLVAKHRYPEQYLFAITNHGVCLACSFDDTYSLAQLNRITEQDGLAASLVRPRSGAPPSSSSGHPIPPSDYPLSTQEPSQSRPDVEMDVLTSRMGGLTNSLDFIPRGLRKKERAG